MNRYNNVQPWMFLVKHIHHTSILYINNYNAIMAPRL